MPESEPENPKPVVKVPYIPLIAIVLVALGAGLGLILVDGSYPQTVAGFFFLSLAVAIITYGFLGATGFMKTSGGQLGGSAAVFLLILVTTLSFIGEAKKEIKGSLYLDESSVGNARIVLMETDDPDFVRNLTPDKNGMFRFNVNKKKDVYLFEVSIPGLGTKLVGGEADKDGWIRLRLKKEDFDKPQEEEDSEREKLNEFLSICKTGGDDCTLYLFDYFESQLDPNELDAFHNFQFDRLHRGIREHLRSRNLLLGTSFRLKRCAELEVRDEAIAARAASALEAPAVLWGFIARSNNQLSSVTSMTLVDEIPMTLHAEENIGANVIEILRLSEPLSTRLLSMAAYVLGETYMRKGNNNLALQAFRHARELQLESDEFVRVVDKQIEKLSLRNPAAGLTPIEG